MDSNTTCATLSLALLWATTGCVAPARPVSEVERNQQLKAELAEKRQAIRDAREQNRQRQRENRNLEKTVQQMESVVASIRDPENHTILVPPPDGIQVLETILDEPLAGGRPVDATKGEFVDMPDGKKALRIVVDPAEEKKDRRAGFPLPAAELVGTKLRCTILAKAENISKPPVHWAGGKFQLWVRTPDKSYWPAAQIGGGSFDWKQLTFTYDVPFDATAITLFLGLEQVSGTMFFRDLKVETIE